MISAWSTAVTVAATLTLVSMPANGQQSENYDGVLTPENLLTIKQLGNIQALLAGLAALYTESGNSLAANETVSDMWPLRREASGWTEPVRLTQSNQDDTRPEWHRRSGYSAFLHEIVTQVRRPQAEGLLDERPTRRSEGDLFA